jgi:hypothetical protein
MFKESGETVRGRSNSVGRHSAAQTASLIRSLRARCNSDSGRTIAAQIESSVVMARSRLISRLENPPVMYARNGARPAFSPQRKSFHHPGR